MSSKLLKLNTQGLITVPEGVPTSGGKWEYEFHHGELDGFLDKEGCSYGELTGMIVSYPNVLITNIFIDLI